MNGMRPASMMASVLALVSIGTPRGGTAQQQVDLPRRDRELEPRLETLATIGSFDGQDWETFGEVSDLDFDGAGNLYVFDGQKQRVVVVDPVGRFLRVFGKAGDGPGELRSPTAIVVMRDGTTAVADMGHRAFVMFGPDGQYQRAVGFGGDAGLTVLGRLYGDGRGGVLSAGQQMVMMQRAVGPGAPSGPIAPPRGHPIVRFTLAGEGEGAQRTLMRAWQPPREETPGPAIQRGVGGRANVAFRGPEAVAFEPQLHSGALPDGGLAFSDSSAYAIKIMGPDGAVRRVLRRPLEPRRVTRRIQEDEKARRLAELEQGGGPQMRIMVAGPGGGAQPISQDQIEQMRRQQIEQMTFYPEIPVVRDLTTGWTGKIWVQRWGRDVSAAGPIDVITSGGEYVGTITNQTELPRAFGPDGRAAYVVRDELDVPRVVVRRLPAELR